MFPGLYVVRCSDFITNVTVRPARDETMLIFCPPSFREGISPMDHIAQMPESSDTRSLLVADVPGGWRRPWVGRDPHV